MKRYIARILLIALSLPASLLSSAATPPTGSLLSDGRWIKVKVDSTGVYQLPAKWLMAQGFEDPERVIVAGYGSVERAHTLDTAPDDLPILPVRRTSDGILFMAEGDMRVIPSEGTLTVHRNHYSRGSYYYIGVRDGVASPEMPTADVESTAAKQQDRKHIGKHLCAVYHDYIDMRPYEHGLYSFSHNFAQSGYTMRFCHADAADTTACVRFTLAWYAVKDGTTVRATLPDDGHTTDGAAHEFTLNRNNAVNNTIYSTVSKEISIAVSASLDTVSVKLEQLSPAIAQLLALRTASMVYSRFNRGADATRLLHFHQVGASYCVDFTDLPEGAEVWDVSAMRSPRRLALTPSADTQGLSSVTPETAGSCTLVAFDPSTAPVPQLTGELECQSLHEMEDVDMLIVATSVTTEAAERLAQAHRSLQGIKVGVVQQQQVMNEFSSGAIHPNGLRAMVKMLRERQRPLQYLMLMGRGSSDTRRDFDKSPLESLVTYATEDLTENGNENKCHTSDYYFGITKPGNIGPSLASTLLTADVSVGRIPVDNLADANDYVDKCIGYLSNPHSAGALNHLLISSCYGDGASHILGAEDIAVNTFSRLMPGATVSRNYMDLYPLESTNLSLGTRRHFKNSLSIGPRLMTYMGHGESNYIILTCYGNPDVATTAFGSLPVCILACCFSTDINLDRTSIGELMLRANPGPICVIAPGTSVLLTRNVNFVRRLTERLCSPETKAIGDAYRLAVNGFMTNSGVTQTTNNLCYNFTGDPALPSLIPSRTVSLAKLNGKAVDSQSSAMVCAPGDRLSLTGTIVTADGEVDSDFTGTLYIDIFDGAVSRKSLNHEKSVDHNNDYYLLDETVVGRYATSVKEGNWEIVLTVPQTVNRAEANRLAFNAYTNGFVTASGASSSIAIAPAGVASADVPADTVGPDIEIFIGDTVFTSGDMVGHSPLLTIILSDTVSGVSLNHAMPGAAPAVRLDGQLLDRVSRIFAPGSDGTATASYTLTDITDGRHELAVTAVDLAGNRSTRSVTFTVASSIPAELTSSTTIARDDVTFNLSHRLALAEGSSPDVSRLVIRDLQGNPVRTVEAPSYPYTWNLLDDDSQPVADGTYRITAILRSEPMFSAAPEIKVTVFRSIE